MKSMRFHRIPGFVLHLYDSALLNKAALRVIGYTRDTPNPPGVKFSGMSTVTRPAC